MSNKRDLMNECHRATLDCDEDAFEIARDALYELLVDRMIHANSIKELYEKEIFHIRQTETSIDEKAQANYDDAVDLMTKALEADNRDGANLQYRRAGACMKYLMRPESLVVLYSDGRYIKCPMTDDEMMLVKGDDS